MITVKKELTITAGTAPYNYAWINPSSCATIANPIGVSLDGNITTTIQFPDEYCLNHTKLQIMITDAEGCINTFDVEVNSPCADLLVSDIQYGGDYEFSILATGGNPSYSYFWQYDSIRFSADSYNQSVLSLTRLGHPNGETSTTVKCTVTDAKGCSKVKTYTLNFCAPVGTPQYISLVCDSSVHTAHRYHSVLEATTCTNSTILWDTIVFTGFPSGMTIETNYPGEPNAIDISVNLNNVPTGTYSGHYVISNTYGISTSVPLTVYVPDCSTPEPIYGLDTTISLTCPVTVGNTVTVDLDSLVVSGSPIDWTTFAFHPLSGQSNPSQNTLVGAMGTYVMNLDHDIVLTVALTNVPAEVVRWTVCNENGDCIANATITFIIGCVSLPIANGDTFCATCGNATAYLNVLANDVGPYTASTVTITVPPMHGSAVVNGSGAISYTPNSTFSGIDLLTYTVTNTPTGAVSNPAIVTFNVICAGIDSS